MSTKTVYWAPWVVQEDNVQNWNMMFIEPEKLINKVIKYLPNLNGERMKASLRCPAFTNLARNTYYVKNPIETELTIENGQINIISKNANVTQFGKEGSTDTIIYGNYYIFFCEEDLEILLTSPHFSETNYTEHGLLVPGKFNISKWFRPVTLEMLLVKNQNYFKMQENETMAYFTFLTDDKVELKRFNLNETLKKISSTCATASYWWKNVPLIKRYDRFIKTKTNRLVMSEIQKELVV